MFKLNVFLLSIAIMTALFVVTAQHKQRRLFVALQEEDKITHTFGEDYNKLLLEQSTQGMHSRVESAATRSLHMKTPEPARIRVVTANGEPVLIIPPKEE